MNQPLSDEMTLDDAVPRQNKYCAKEEVGQGLLVTISHMTVDDIEDNGVFEKRTVLRFHGDTKPLILNQTNKELLKVATKATTIGGVKEKQIVLYNDETIMFGGKMTGGIRLRAPKQKALPEPDFAEEIPF